MKGHQHDLYSDDSDKEDDEADRSNAVDTGRDRRLHRVSKKKLRKLQDMEGGNNAPGYFPNDAYAVERPVGEFQKVQGALVLRSPPQ